jgi:hypothetical protein
MFDHRFDYCERIVVLPESQNHPSVPHKNLICTSVPVAVSLDLGFPPFPIRFGCRSVDGASVPETPIEEHDYTTTRPHDVTAETIIVQKFAIDAVAVAAGVKPAPHLHLDLGAGRLLGLHLSSNLFGRRNEPSGGGAWAMIKP